VEVAQCGRYELLVVAAADRWVGMQEERCWVRSLHPAERLVGSPAAARRDSLLVADTQLEEQVVRSSAVVRFQWLRQCTVVVVVGWRCLGCRHSVLPDSP
jgi:hypothetical protein